MSIRLLPFLMKNLLRSKTRLVATVGGCAVAAFVVAFFLTAQFSLASLLLQEEGRVNLVVAQKDRY